MMLPSCDAKQARAVMMRLRSALKHALGRGTVPAFTFSAGVAAYPAEGGSVDELARAADRALYDAKRTGRDRVVLAAEGAPASRRPTSRCIDEPGVASAPADERQLIELPVAPSSRAVG